MADVKLKKKFMTEFDGLDAGKKVVQYYIQLGGNTLVVSEEQAQEIIKVLQVLITKKESDAQEGIKESDLPF